MASLAGQANHVFERMEAFGESRFHHSPEQRARRIYSFATRHHYTVAVVQFLVWCAAVYGIRQLCELTPELAYAYIEHLASMGRSPATIATYAAAIRKLDVGLRHIVGWRRGKPSLLGEEYAGRHADRVADPFSAVDAQRLIDALSRRDPQYGQIAMLQRSGGLRAVEAVHLQAPRISVDGARIELYGPGIHTKGGRGRTAPVLSQFRNQVLALRELGLSHDDKHLFVHRQSLDKAMEHEVSRLGRQLGIVDGSGSHSFRKCYAVDLCDYAVDVLKLPHNQAMLMVSEALGHERTSVLVSYINSERLNRR